jgi:hypothetical protein
MDHNLFQEIDEDLDRQKVEAFWKKYGVWVIVAALGLVVSTASSTAYRSWKAGHEQRLTSELIASSQSDEAAKSIDALQAFAAENKGETLAAIALLRAASFAAEHKDTAKAIVLYDSLAEQPKADPAFRQLAALLSVKAQLDGGDFKLLEARLQPLTAPGAPWRYSAQEALATLALRAGDKAKAKTIYATLARDTQAPPSLASRASDILRIMD